jgi:hypothetical protein
MDQIFSVIIIHFVNVVAVKCNFIWLILIFLFKLYFRLNKGAYAPINSSIQKSLTTTDLISIQTVSSSISDEQIITSTNTNTIVSTRLRQTNKRLLRKIHSTNSIIPIQEKSMNFN